MQCAPTKSDGREVIEPLTEGAFNIEYLHHLVFRVETIIKIIGHKVQGNAAAHVRNSKSKSVHNALENAQFL